MSEPTLAEAIRAAHEAVEKAQAAVDLAEAERARVIRLALERGGTLRDVADLLPVSFNTVRRWAGDVSRPNVLEQKVASVEGDRGPSS